MDRCIIIWLLWMASSTAAIVFTPSIFCDGIICKCGQDLAICLCRDNLQGVTVRPNDIHPSVSNITITNCKTVQFQSGSIRNNTGLRHLNIQNVGRLQLPEKAFEWYGDSDGNVLGRRPTDGVRPRVRLYQVIDTPRLAIHITNTTIKEVSRHAFNGNIKDILLTNVNITTIAPYAFSNLNGNEKIIIKNTRIDTILVQGFKKFTTLIFMLMNTTINSDVITSRTFADVEVREMFKIGDGCRFNTVKPSAFIITMPKKVEISESTFQQWDSEAFRIVTRGDTVIRNNAVGALQSNAFVGIMMDKSTLNLVGKQDFVFINNTVREIYANALDVNQTGYNIKVDMVRIQEVCACDRIHQWVGYLGKSVSLSAVQCMANANTDTVISIGDYKTANCDRTTSKTVTIVLVVIGVVVAVAVLGALIGICLYRRHKAGHQKEWINNASPLAHRKVYNNKKNGGGDANGKLPIIMPDGRTYRETIVVVEKAELLTTEL